MGNIFSEKDLKLQILNPDDGYHYFFGYYDMRAEDGSGLHLCHRVPFMDRLPTADDVAEIGYLKNREFTKIGETTAWNFQQGAMLQFHPHEKNTVCYNVCNRGIFSTAVQNIGTGETRYTDRAIACLSPDGNWGLAVNFGRIYAFRPGYGYAGYTDKYADVPAPKEDGVFLTDMNTGVSRMLVDYAALAIAGGFDVGDKIVVNHITFSPDSDRYIMLLRNFPAPGKKGWSTSLMAGDRSGKVWTILGNTYASHYSWADSKNLLIHCSPDKDGPRRVYRVDTDSAEAICYPLAQNDDRDIHCNVSPDGRYMIGDSYPWRGEGDTRNLYGYSFVSGRWEELLRADTVTPPVIDIRCDLHARYTGGQKFITFDSTHRGKRDIVQISAEILDF